MKQYQLEVKILRDIIASLRISKAETRTLMKDAPSSANLKSKIYHIEEAIESIALAIEELKAVE